MVGVGVGVESGPAGKVGVEDLTGDTVGVLVLVAIEVAVGVLVLVAVGVVVGVEVAVAVGVVVEVGVAVRVAVAVGVFVNGISSRSK